MLGVALFAASRYFGRPNNVDHSVARARVDSGDLGEHYFVKERTI